MPQRYEYSPVRPLFEGDLVSDQTVAGFGWKAATDNVRSTHLDDRLLLRGEEALAEPPDRPMPRDFVAVAPVPPADLPDDRRQAATDVDAALPQRVEAFLSLPAAPWQPLVRSLIGAIHAVGHRVWLSGGSARDLVAGAQLHDIKDLDLAGTVPTGRFSDILYQTLRAHAMSAFPMTVNPRSLVCAVELYYSDTRMLEYRGLSRGGFQFGAVGSSLAEDARQRDFAFNAILYDPVEHEVLDASGHGVHDLLGGVRCFRPLSRPAEPAAAAEVIVRALKFFIRWRGRAMDLDPFTAWVATLPDDLVTRIRLDRLIRYYRRDRHADSHLDERYAFAQQLPKPGHDLLTAVLAGAR